MGLWQCPQGSMLTMPPWERGLHCVPKRGYPNRGRAKLPPMEQTAISSKRAMFSIWLPPMEQRVRGKEECPQGSKTRRG